MNQRINEAVGEILESAKKSELPKTVEDAVLDSVNKSQEASAKWIALLKDVSKDYEGLVAKAGANARAINDRVLDNAAKNSQAVLDHAAAAVKTGDVNAAVKGQFEFVSAQLGIWNDQQVELLDLSSKIANDMLEATSKATNSTIERFSATI